MNETKVAAAAVGLTMLLAANVPAGAAEIKVISSNALKTTLEQLAPAFEKATEHNTRGHESMKSLYLLKKAFNRLPANHARSHHQPYFNTEKVSVLMARLQGKELYWSRLFARSAL